MTDQELIALLDERPPREWTPEELAELRTRLPHSPELRAALQSELRLEQGLSEHLGRYDVPVDAIIARAAGKQGWRLGVLLGWTAAALLLGIGALYWNSLGKRPDEIAKVDATSEATSAATAEGSAAATGDSTGVAPIAASEATAEGSAAGTPMGEQNPTTALQPFPTPPPAEVKIALREADLFEDFARVRVPPTEDELKKTLKPLPGGGSRYFQGPDRAGAGFEGQGRFELPGGRWPVGATLRMALYEIHRFKLTAWSGLDGATCQFVEGDPQRWVGYRARREKLDEWKNLRLSIAGTDDNRWQRMGDGWLDLRYEEGRLKLCRADVVLLDLPLAEPPTELHFDGHVCVRAMEWVSTAAPSVPPALAVETVYRSVDPANLPWTTVIPGDAKFERRPDGSASFEAKGKNEKDSYAASVVDRAGMYAVDFLVEDPQPGTGVFLGDGAGQPIVKVGFFRDRRSNTLVINWVPHWEANVETDYDPNWHTVPHVGQKQWLRLVVGANCVRCFASPDGKTWGTALEPYRQQHNGENSVAGVVSSGVYLLRGDSPRSLKLREMAVIEPTALRDAGGIDAGRKALAFAFATDAAEWLKLVAEHKPVGIDEAAWRCACAYKTLAHGPDPKLVPALWTGLLEDALRLAPTVDARLSILQGATLAAYAWEPQDAKPWFQRYEAVGRELNAAGDPAPWSKLRLAMIFCPLQTRGWFNVEPTSLARQELLQLVANQDWTAVRELVRRVRVHNQPVHPHHRPREERKDVLDLADWCDAVASRALPRQAGETIALSVDWRRPLVEQLSKEGYNLLAEFEAALRSKSYRDACQIVASCSPGAALGVAPDARDPSLLVSLPSAVALAMRDQPELQKTMEKEFGPVGKFRVRAATTEADAAAVEAATVQFYGTAAAAEAHVWLGDRALATGDFASAGSQYRRAAETLGKQPSPALEARRRLAAAFQGREYGSPVTAPVALGDQTLSAQAFEALVASARARGERNSSLGDATPVPSADAPPPVGEYAFKPFAQTTGENGRENDRLFSKEYDPVARTTTTLIAGNLFVTHNRFQTTAYDLQSGQQKWSVGLGGQQGHAHKWITPMRPILVQGKLILRRLTENGPELAALELQTGKVLWRQQPGHHVASDPMWIQQELFALGVSSVGADQLQLELVTFALDTGEPVARRKLALFRNAWSSAIPCTATAAGDRVVAAAGGAVLCADLLGQVLWLREQTWIPSKQDDAAGSLGTSTPIVSDGKVYVSQPNVRMIECLDLDGGRLHWRRTYESLQGLVGLAGAKRDVLVVGLDEAIEALRLADGQTLWRRTGELAVEATTTGPDSVLAVERVPVTAEQRRVRFMWLDPQHGKQLAASLVAAQHDQAKPEGKLPQLGPTVAAGGRFWTYFASEERTTERKIFELTQVGPAPTSTPGDPGAARYAQASPRLINEAASFTPDWLLLVSPENPESGRRLEWEGRKNVMITFCRSTNPSVWGGLATVSGDKPAALKIEAGLFRNEPYRIVVAEGGRTLGEWVVSPETVPNKFATFEVDLTPFAGRATWIDVRHESHQSRESHAVWQSIRVATP